MRILVGIPTVGRRAILTETLRELTRQTRLPDQVIVAPVSPADVDLGALAELPFPADIVMSSRGLSRQRNAILGHAKGFDIVVFLDDDFFPEVNYLSTAERLFNRDSVVVLATGAVLKDGIKGPGLTAGQARIELASACKAKKHVVTTNYGAYGCNMVVRLAPVLRHGLVFDETLPLYAWQEDTDFSRQLAPFGRIVRVSALAGVHLGVKDGRVSGLRFGYSQIANPIYLIRKGTMSRPRAGRLMAKNLMANFVRLMFPEAHVDRMGRCKGNLRALTDLSRGRLHPSRILDFE